MSILMFSIWSILAAAVVGRYRTPTRVVAKSAVLGCGYGEPADARSLGTDVRYPVGPCGRYIVAIDTNKEVISFTSADRNGTNQFGLRYITGRLAEAPCERDQWLHDCYMMAVGFEAEAEAVCEYPDWTDVEPATPKYPVGPSGQQYNGIVGDAATFTDPQYGSDTYCLDRIRSYSRLAVAPVAKWLVECIKIDNPMFMEPMTHSYNTAIKEHSELLANLADERAFGVTHRHPDSTLVLSKRPLSIEGLIDLLNKYPDHSFIITVRPA